MLRQLGQFDSPFFRLRNLVFFFPKDTIAKRLQSGNFFSFFTQVNATSAKADFLNPVLDSSKIRDAFKKMELTKKQI